MCKYYLLIANTRGRDNYFDELCEDFKENSNHIPWNPRREINENDICLIYYNNLRDGTSRVLFIGKVEESDYSSNNHLLFSTIFMSDRRANALSRLNCLCVLTVNVSLNVLWIF